MTIPSNITRFAPWPKELFPSGDELARALTEEGYSPTLLRDQPGEFYDWHSHETAQLLVIASGSMQMRLRSETFDMEPGDRLYLAPHEEHAAVVGAAGVTYFDVPYS